MDDFALSLSLYQYAMREIVDKLVGTLRRNGITVEDRKTGDLLFRKLNLQKKEIKKGIRANTHSKSINNDWVFNVLKTHM